MCGHVPQELATAPSDSTAMNMLTQRRGCNNSFQLYSQKPTQAHDRRP